MGQASEEPESLDAVHGERDRSEMEVNSRRRHRALTSPGLSLGSDFALLSRVRVETGL